MSPPPGPRRGRKCPATPPCARSRIARRRRSRISEPSPPPGARRGRRGARSPDRPVPAEWKWRRWCHGSAIGSPNCGALTLACRVETRLDAHAPPWKVRSSADQPALAKGLELFQQEIDHGPKQPKHTICHGQVSSEVKRASREVSTRHAGVRAPRCYRRGPRRGGPESRRRPSPCAPRGRSSRPWRPSPPRGENTLGGGSGRLAMPAG